MVTGVDDSLISITYFIDASPKFRVYLFLLQKTFHVMVLPATTTTTTNTNTTTTTATTTTSITSTTTSFFPSENSSPEPESVGEPEPEDKTFYNIWRVVAIVFII